MRWNVDGQAGGLVRRVTAAFAVVRRAAARPSVRPWLLGVAAVAFLAMAYVSFRSLPEDGRSARPLLVVPMVVLAAPATLVLNAVEYRAMAAGLGHRLGMRSAMRVGLTASLANYLPAPGGVAVRTAALKGRGSSIGRAVSINAVAGATWLAVAALLAGCALVVTASVGRGAAAMAAGGVILSGVVVVWAHRGGPGWRATFGRLLVAETGIVVVAGLRLWIALAAIGQAASLGAAVAISCSTVIAAAVGIFPAGLGLREAIGGGLATTVDVPVATAVAAMAVDRVCGQAGMALCAPLLGLGRRRPREDSDDDNEARSDTEPSVTGPFPAAARR